MSQLHCALPSRSTGGMAGGFGRIRAQVARDGTPSSATIALLTGGQISPRQYQDAVRAGESLYRQRVGTASA